MNSLPQSAQLQNSILQGKLDNISESEKYRPKLGTGIKSLSPGQARIQEISVQNFKKALSQDFPVREKISF